MADQIRSSFCELPLRPRRRTRAATALASQEEGYVVESLLKTSTYHRPMHRHNSGGATYCVRATDTHTNATHRLAIPSGTKLSEVCEASRSGVSPNR